MDVIGKLKNGKTAMNEAARNSGILVEMDIGTRKKLQATLLEMYKDVKSVCDRHGIVLYVIGGSALGAVRHKGFIPWDDDMDLSMTRRDYRRFCEIFEDELSDKYILNAPNYSERAKNRFPRILKKDSYYRAVIDNDDDSLHCIFLDIFILDNTPDNKIARKLKGTVCNFLYIMSWEVFIFENRNEEMKRFLLTSGKADYYVRVIIGGIFSFRKSYKWFNTFDKVMQHKNESSRDCCLPTGRKRYFGEIMRREQWFPGVHETFEGEDVLIFQDKDYYLRNLYGDYMQIPPEDKRERHTTCEIRFER
ncbi:MAG: LicD family protein [Oscillospiraceae bacterium]|nr:LicD family protein [Oscillospiraceae bacterium]